MVNLVNLKRKKMNSSSNKYIPSFQMGNNEVWIRECTVHLQDVIASSSLMINNQTHAVTNDTMTNCKQPFLATLPGVARNQMNKIGNIQSSSCDAVYQSIAKEGSINPSSKRLSCQSTSENPNILTSNINVTADSLEHPLPLTSTKINRQSDSLKNNCSPSTNVVNNISAVEEIDLTEDTPTLSPINKSIADVSSSSPIPDNQNGVTNHSPPLSHKDDSNTDTISCYSISGDESACSYCSSCEECISKHTDHGSTSAVEEDSTAKPSISTANLSMDFRTVSAETPGNYSMNDSRVSIISNDHCHIDDSVNKALDFHDDSSTEDYGFTEVPSTNSETENSMGNSRNTNSGLAIIARSDSRTEHPTPRLKRNKNSRTRDSRQKILKYKVTGKYSSSRVLHKRIFKCTECNYFGHNEKIVVKHFKQSHKKKVKCCICDFAIDKEYFSHLEGHFDGPPFFCPRCEYRSDEIKNLIKHVPSHTILKCNLCKYTCSNASSLKKHKLSHRSRGTFKCTMCCKSYRRVWQLKKHMKKCVLDECAPS